MKIIQLPLLANDKKVIGSVDIDLENCTISGNLLINEENGKCIIDDIRDHVIKEIEIGFKVEDGD